MEIVDSKLISLCINTLAGGDIVINFLYAEINIIGIVLLLLFLNNMNKNSQNNYN
jgi:hypothetical protein